MTTWAPVNVLGENAKDPSVQRVHPNPFTATAMNEQREREAKEAQRQRELMASDPYNSTYEGKLYNEPVRLWPEELKELSRRAGDLEKAKKGI